MRRHRSERGGLRTITEPDVTPLVDLTFLLLIVFMITAPVLEYAVEVTPPELNAEPIAPDNRHHLIQIDRHGTITLDGDKLTLSELRTRLSSIVSETPDTPVFIRADESRPYGDVVGVMRSVRKAGLFNVSFVTAEEGG